jgi:hypothetical protein
MRACAVSIDLDEIGEYRALYGLVATGHEQLVYQRALPRAIVWAREHRIPLTLFAIGRDLERAANAERVRAAVVQGHAVENHTHSHRYDLVAQGRAIIEREVRAGQRAIAQITGRTPKAFRAPGYTTSDALFEVLAAEGYEVDSSLLPCPGYYAAKAVAVAAIAASGRRSASFMGTPRAIFAPRTPHDRAGLLEIPIAVTRRTRLPFIGTAVTLAGPHLARRLARGCADLAVVSFELHGIDFLDASDGLADLARHQLDLRVPLARKLGALSAAVGELSRLGSQFTTLADAATEWRALVA